MSLPEPNPEQLAIIAKNEGSFLVAAPPGSGKTFVLTQRIIRLLSESSREHFRILALTFTTKAAENMRNRVELAIGENWRRVLITNFHSFCLDLLQNYGEPIGLARDMTVYENDNDRLEALTRGLRDDGYEIGTTDEVMRTLKDILTQIGRLKRDLVPFDAAPTSIAYNLISLRIAYSAYDRTLRRYNALDFDDLLILAYKLLVEAPRVAKHVRKLYKFILIDEAQDTSRAQYEILKTICSSEHRNVMMVADGDQYIYRFTGASDRYLHLFLEDFNAQLISLRINYRCAGSIVEAANSLISHNPGRLAPDQIMRPSCQAVGHVTATSFQDEDEEATAVVDQIQTLLTEGLDASWVVEGETPELHPHDICILGRFRYSLTRVVNELKSREIAFHYNNAEPTLFESSLFQFIYYGLRILVNPRDLLSRENLLSLCEFLPPDEAAFTELREASHTVMFSRLSEIGNDPISFAAHILSDASKQPINPKALLKQICDLSQLEDPTIDESMRALHMIDYGTMHERWLNCRRRYAEKGEPILSDLLGEIALAGRSVIEGDGIRVLTVHAAKGLEFQCVFVLGLVEGGFPDFRSSKTVEGVAEERRNAYVAVTRAARRLILTYPRIRIMPWGDARAQTASRFFSEMKISPNRR